MTTQSTSPFSRGTVTYTDGTPVRAGDRIRYHQAPGGLLPPPSDGRGNVAWREGVAIPLSERDNPTPERRAQMIGYGIDPDELVLRDRDGRCYGLLGHVIERLG